MNSLENCSKSFTIISFSTFDWLQQTVDSLFPRMKLHRIRSYIIRTFIVSDSDENDVNEFEYCIIDVVHRNGGPSAKIIEQRPRERERIMHNQRSFGSRVLNVASKTIEIRNWNIPILSIYCRVYVHITRNQPALDKLNVPSTCSTFNVQSNIETNILYNPLKRKRYQPSTVVGATNCKRRRVLAASEPASAVCYLCFPPTPWFEMWKSERDFRCFACDCVFVCNAN